MNPFSAEHSNRFIPALVTLTDNPTEHSATASALSPHILSSITNMELRHRDTATNRTSGGSGSTFSALDGHTDSRTIFFDPPSDPKFTAPGRELGHSIESNFPFDPQFNVSPYPNSSTEMGVLTDWTQFSRECDPSTPSSPSSSSGSSMHVLLTPIYGESEPQIKEHIMDMAPNFGLAIVGTPGHEEGDSSTYQHPEPAAWPDSGMWIAPCNRTTLPTSDMRSSMPFDDSELSLCGLYEPERLQGFPEVPFEYHKDYISGQLDSPQQNPYLYPSPDSVYTPFDSTSSSSISTPSESESDITQSTIIPLQPAPSYPSLKQTSQLTVLQPRPRRCIPIVSLSEIASAWGMSSKNTSLSQEALSPLDLHCHEYTTVFSQSHPLSLANTNPIQVGGSCNPIPSGSMPSPMDTSTDPVVSCHNRVPTGIVLCSCGCMESYVIPEERSTYLL